MQIGYLLQAGVPDVRPPVVSGPGKHVVHVIRGLIELGHRVRTIVVLDGRIWRSDDLLEFTPIRVDYIDRGPLRLLERLVRRIQGDLKLPYLSLFDSVRFARAACQELAGCDLLYERFGWMGYGGAIAAKALEVPHVLEVNGDHLSEMEMLGVAPRGLQLRISSRVTGWAALRASRTVAAGAGWGRRHIERWGLAPETVSTVDNGSEFVEILQRSQLRAFRSDDGDCGPITIAYIGAFEPWSGLAVLMNALADVVSRGIDVRLVLAGNGSLSDSLKQLRNDLGLNGCVTFTGQLEPCRVASLLADSHIGVSPYCGRVEFSGLKLIDYKSAGLAIIASGQAGEPAVLDDGRTGWVVPPCDARALAEAIALLASNIELRNRLGRAARIEAERDHSWKITAAHLDALFQQTVSTQRGRERA